MSTTRNRNLLIIITVLLLTNIGVLAYFLSQKEKLNHHPQSGTERTGISEMLQKEVGFDEQQVLKYKGMKETQKNLIRPLYDNMRKAKDSLFSLISFPNTPDTLITKTADLIARQQKQIDLETFYYFRRVRSLCKPGQETNFDSMVVRMFRRMGKPVRHNQPEKTDSKK